MNKKTAERRFLFGKTYLKLYLVYFIMCALLRPWLNWIEQQISNLWVAGSSPAGRARVSAGCVFMPVFFLSLLVQIWSKSNIH